MTNFNWYFAREEIDNKTPSREDGVTLSTEIRYRREGARLIINASNTLGLRYETTATGVVFFHRFYMIQSFRQFSRWVVASACLLLAGKVEETPKKCRDIIKVCQALLSEHQMSHFGSNPKDELMTHERILLQTIKFDLQVEHPYAYLLKFAKQLKGEKAKIEKLVQMAWTFMNDSLCTSLCLQWEPQAIAIAFIYLAGKLSKFDLVTATQSKSRSWWRQYLDTLDVHDLESICHQVLDIYGEEENKSGEESAATPGQTTPHSTPSTPHSSHQQPLTSSQYPQQQPPTICTYPQLPITVHQQQYPPHYQPPVTAMPQQPQTRTTPYSGIPSVQTPPIVPTPTIRHTTQTTPAQPVTTPLAYSTLNVSVSPMAPSHPILPQPPAVQASAIPRTVTPGSYQYLPPGTIPPLQATSPGGLALQQRAYLSGNTTYPPMQTYKPSFIASGNGQAPLSRPPGSINPPAGLLSVGGAVGRGSMSPTPPRPAHPLPHPQSIMPPQHGYGVLTSHTSAQTHHHTQSSSPAGVRPASGGGTSGSIGWSR